MFEELIKRLREAPNDWYDADLHYEAADAIEELQGELQALKDDTDMAFVKEGNTTYLRFVKKWIPVTERLPKENGFYLCLYKHKASGGVAMDEGLSILQWINNKWGINDIYLVTYWMPLPQPPESEE